MKELQDLYSGDKDIPDIDFQKYTLIIGKKSLSHSYHWIIKQELVLNNGQLELYLYIPHLNSYYSAIQEMGFWGLYHKLQAKEISLNVIEVDD